MSETPFCYQLCTSPPMEQLSLFPELATDVCAEIGLNWLAAQQLAADGVISSLPIDGGELEPGVATELRFVGAMVVAGCDRRTLNLLLSDLPAPYRYDHRTIYYNWQAAEWQQIQQQEQPEPTIDELLEQLAEDEDIDELERLRERIDAMAARWVADQEQQG